MLTQEKHLYGQNPDEPLHPVQPDLAATPGHGADLPRPREPRDAGELVQPQLPESAASRPRQDYDPSGRECGYLI